MIYLSVVIPVRNEARFIKATLETLIGQEYPRDRFELLVVDGRSGDETRAIVQRVMARHPESNILLLDNPGLLSSRARNVGVRAARGTMIAVIDGHVHIPDRHLFESMERLKEGNAALCLSRPAPLDVPGLCGGNSYWIAAARKCWLGHSTKSFIYSSFEGWADPVSAGFAYDRSVFEKVGYFDESFDAAEDVEFHYRLKRAGIMSFTSPSLMIYSYPRDSLSALFRQQARYGDGRARLVRKHPDSFTLETLVPVGVFLMTLLAGPALLTLPVLPLPSLLVLGLFCAYAAILFGTGLYESLRRGTLAGAHYLALAVWTTHFSLGWGFSRTWLAHRRGACP